MTKEEIMMKYVVKDGVVTLNLGKDILKAMDEYGRQCFDAGIDWEYVNYDDYLKELEKYNLSK